AGDHAVGIALRDHHAREVDRLPDPVTRLRTGEPLALPALVQPFRVALLPRLVGDRVQDLDAIEVGAEVVGDSPDPVLAAQEDRPRDPFVHDPDRGADDALVLALREDDPLRVAPRLDHEVAHDLARAAEPGLEAVAVLVQVELDACDTGLH